MGAARGLRLLSLRSSGPSFTSFMTPSSKVRQWKEASQQKPQLVMAVCVSLSCDVLSTNLFLSGIRRNTMDVNVRIWV